VFTGIVKHVGRVVAVRATEAGKRLRIDVGPLAEGLLTGASVAVEGACLTVAGLSGAVAEFDAVPETLGLTTLGSLAAGAKVNLEPALVAGAPIDGHIVQGHVDGIATVARIDTRSGRWELALRAAGELTDQMVPKGSVALAGVSLTLVDVSAGAFSVALVPTTLQRTRLGELKISDPLNLELDIMGKYVRRHLRQMAGGGLTIDKLRDEGFA